ncbi:MAG TPA: putative sugar O-methyltransferase [Verrucomicrobiae bacterium]|jgi:putative sugar O-methyltransferase
MEKLADYGSNIYSQFGEDGIIQKILSILGPGGKTCVEFGAWDGFHLSNTANLWAKQQWKGILIEAVPERFQELQKNTKGYDCLCIQAKVEPEGENTLENILRRNAPGAAIDLLSIDIDGDDYYILDSLKSPMPRIVICEYNPTMPPTLELVAEKGSYFGSSALAIVRLAEKKGLKLITVTDTNCFFVRSEDFPKFAGFQTDLLEIAVIRQLTYFISGYAGDYLLSGKPVYGCSHPSEQQFVQGGLYYWPDKEQNSKPPRPSWMQSQPQWARFRKLIKDVKPVYTEWDTIFSPVAAEFVHPLWRKAQKPVADLILQGLPRNFLENPATANQFCRKGFGDAQYHELSYLLTRAPELRGMIRRFKESPIGRPNLDCGQLQVSANSLGMLYYFARISERLKPPQQHTIVEFGGGYGCLCRVFLDLLPERPTYIIIDLPEMLALQYVFLQATSTEYKVVPHFSEPLKIVPNAINLVPVSLAGQLPVKPDLFVSTFALSETPKRVQERVACDHFYDGRAVYLVGQYIDADLWKNLALESSQPLLQAVRRDYSQVQIGDYHFASAWELFACNPGRPGGFGNIR